MNITKIDELRLDLHSKLQDLPLWNENLELEDSGNRLIQLFEQEPLIPGVILTQNHNYVGMISRRQFFEFMSRPYSLGLFAERAISHLYDYLQPEISELSGNTTVIEATQIALKRTFQLVYEPIVVKVLTANSQVYQLLDIHNLLLAHSQIQILTLRKLEQAESQSRIHQADLDNFKQKQVVIVQQQRLQIWEQLKTDINREILHPTKLIIGNLIHANRCTQDLSQIVNLYQQHYPQPVPEIQAAIGKIKIDVFNRELTELLSTTKNHAKRIQKFVHSWEDISTKDIPDVEELNHA
ncbi:hypothetical protein [Brunnivagina elsteri]|uniref:Histidine kinase n=1 Tax=Brunnivagina elsteri CCALA 953 TaxID=987040 RepID=A0A2A2TM46_9CYAN|nr:hypothetical protein [Calothrix elsteri]PAX59469.1 hypothetical protein CK510_06915 [Calothrix elsteri CCALA 953]